MSESPHVREAREHLVRAVPDAVRTLEGLLDAQADGVRLGAAREILDRGGLPARSDHHVDIDVSVNGEIEHLISQIAKQRTGEGSAAAEAEIEDAIIIADAEEGDPEQLGEQLQGKMQPVEHVAGPDAAADRVAELTAPIPTSDPDADPWWQASPPAPF